MVKKIIAEEIEEIEPEEIEEVKISKKTGKPLRPLSDKQKEVLKRGQAAALLKRQQMKESGDYIRKLESVKQAKEDKREITNTKIKNDILVNKKNYEDELVKEDGELPIRAVGEPPQENPIRKSIKKKKKIKIIEYSSESSSSEEEIQYIKKKKDKSKKQQYADDNLISKSSTEILKEQLENDQISKINAYLLPSYY
jgi:hypothetical protein